MSIRRVEVIEFIVSCKIYVLQVGAALRPAFTPETAPDVTAAACEVIAFKLALINSNVFFCAIIRWSLFCNGLSVFDNEA